MNTRITTFLFASFLVLMTISSASAQVQRTYVSGLGSDANPCSRTAPCRTFTQAISQTNPGGEVYVLDTAGYGPFAINKALSIVAQGVTAGISVFSGDGIDINAGSSDTVILRGLTINNQGGTGNGIVFTSGARLQVEGCVVSGFAAAVPGLLTGPNPSGLTFQASQAISGARLAVKDSIFSGNTYGIEIQHGAGRGFATIERTRFEGNFTGLLVRANSFVTVRDSVAAANREGFLALSTSPAPSPELNIESCVASNNGLDGIAAVATGGGAATVRVSNSTVTGNDTGLWADGNGTLLSRGNNTVEGNFSANFDGVIGSYGGK